MQVRQDHNPPFSVAAAILALALLGAISLVLTWRNISAQQEAAYAHMELAAQSILRGVDGGVLRSVLRFMRSRGDADSLAPVLDALFEEFIETDDVLYVGLYSPDGKLWISSQRKDQQGPAPQLAPAVLQSLQRTGSWIGQQKLDERQAFLAATVARIGLPPPPEMMGRMRFLRRCGLPPGPLYLVMALDPKAHLALFRSYRRAALIQTGFVLLTGAALWLLAFALLRRRDASRRVEELERFQSKLLDHTPDGLMTLSAQGEILSANPSASRLLTEGADIIGMRMQDILPGDAPCPGTMQTSGVRPWRQVETAGRHLELLCVPLDPEALDGERLLLLRDRTAIKGLEHELAEAQRLAAIGSLAAGVAHEIRNPLGSLRGFAQLFASRLKDQPPLGEFAVTMVQEADRLNRVVTDLLYLAKPRELHPGPVDLETLAESITRLVHFDLEHAKARLTVDLQAKSVYADSDGLTQVLLNLMANALPALPESGGELCISSRLDGKDVILEVRDNGEGMSPETAAKAFEPFFTGREKGTGLGLAIVKAIVTALRGRVGLQTSPGEGTTVWVRLPSGPQPPAAGGQEIGSE
ncbi:MAG: two-component system, NtrC family, sensor histidine kinase HydH [Desulfovibrionales bacterium]|nr:two-component system, NtrC family, sensor histidine kinase HydH [Desulfovibrionales bacterium]